MNTVENNHLKKFFLIFFLVVSIAFSLFFRFSQTSSPPNIQPTPIPSPTSKKNAPNLFFTFSLTKLNNNLYVIKVFIEGEKQTQFDGVDLSLKFQKNEVEIIEIQNGETFTEYPRKTINENGLIITGIAAIRSNKIKFAQPPSFFASILVKKVNPNQPASLIFDEENSGIYHFGENLLNLENSFKKINL